jgi:5-methylthioribose kinase
MTLLDVTTVGRYALDRGLICGLPTRCVALAGGVSNIVLLVERTSDSAVERVVIKQALGTLRVAIAWHADPARSQAEAAALGVLGQLTPSAVPVVLDADPDRDALAITAAPDHWVMWKSELLGGVVRPQLAARLGTLLGHWHRRTDGRQVGDHETMALPALLERTDLFEQLRLAPYFGTTASRRPLLANDIERVAQRVRDRRRCLVLGDFSPKNILVAGADGPDGAPITDDLWVIDLEVAHRGDPSFDVAFLLTHLMAKSIHQPANRHQLLSAARLFVSHYNAQTSGGLGLDDPTHVAQLLGALLVARVAGSSPLEYLTPNEQHDVEAVGTSLLTSATSTLDDVLGES